MIQMSVSAGIPQLKYGIIPTHKISMAHAEPVLFFYYVAESSEFRQFDEKSDIDLLQLAYAKGSEMKLGQFESFAIGEERNYHLQRVSDTEFVLKSLR